MVAEQPGKLSGSQDPMQVRILSSPFYKKENKMFQPIDLFYIDQNVRDSIQHMKQVFTYKELKNFIKYIVGIKSVSNAPKKLNKKVKTLDQKHWIIFDEYLMERMMAHKANRNIDLILKLIHIEKY